MTDDSGVVDASLTELIEQAFAFATAQYERMLHQVAGRPGFPRSWKDEAIHLVSANDWTAGFFGGSLWQLFEATGDARWRDAAHAFTMSLEPVQHDRSTHDLGFVLYCSFGHGWRLTGNAAYRDVLLQGAASLSSRFNPVVGCIKSWDWSTQWPFPVIIDNLMNLELLMWAARDTENEHWRKIAVSHADTTLRQHFRRDGSCYHVVDYEPSNGRVRRRLTHQGLADESAWARGQAWALYGYTMMYRETGQRSYLARARSTAEFILNHPHLPEDKVPLWDFDAPLAPDTPRDVSAAAIICSALLELSGLVPEEVGADYRSTALQQLRTLASEPYRSEPGGNGGFLLGHSTGHKPGEEEIDVPLNYADYYFLEALLRARRLARFNRKVPQ